MDEWVKILISTTGGFSAAILGEPIKLSLGDYFRRRKLRRALYIELKENLEGLIEVMNLNPSSPFETFDPNVFSRKVLDYAEKQPDLFYTLREAPHFRKAWGAIEQVLDAVEGEHDEAAKLALARISTRVHRDLDKASLRLDRSNSDITRALRKAEKERNAGSDF